MDDSGYSPYPFTLNGADISVKATCEINNTAKGDIVMKGKNITKND
jgi:hypothetical protein